MGDHQRGRRRLSARVGRGRGGERHPPRFFNDGPGAGGLEQRPREHQPCARDHGLHTRMKKLIGGVLMLSAVLVQVTWAPRIEVAGAFPNLTLLAVITVTWTAGVGTGLVWACVGGLLLDLTAPGPIGPHALALLAGAYVCGFWAR